MKYKIGETDPQYGGVVTDIRTLPDMTAFYVCNGSWTGTKMPDNTVYINELDEYIPITNNNAVLSIAIEGVVTDMRTLPVGTKFRLNTGMRHAKKTSDDKILVYDKTPIYMPITDENAVQSIFIY